MTMDVFDTRTPSMQINPSIASEFCPSQASAVVLGLLGGESWLGALEALGDELGLELLASEGSLDALEGLGDELGLGLLPSKGSLGALEGLGVEIEGLLAFEG